MPLEEHFLLHDQTRLAQPEKDESVVYFYRQDKFLGKGVWYFIDHNGKHIGALKGGTYFFYVTEPGEKTFCAETEARVCKTIAMKPGAI